MNDEELAIQERNYYDALAAGEKNFKEKIEELGAIVSALPEKGAEDEDIINNVAITLVQVFEELISRNIVEAVIPQLLTPDSVIPITLIKKYLK